MFVIDTLLLILYTDSLSELCIYYVTSYLKMMKSLTSLIFSQSGHVGSNTPSTRLNSYNRKCQWFTNYICGVMYLDPFHPTWVGHLRAEHETDSTCNFIYIRFGSVTTSVSCFNSTYWLLVILANHLTCYDACCKLL